MPSPLSFANTEIFRKALIARNLEPYGKGPKVTPPVTYEIILRDMSVKDSPDELIDTLIFANQHYVLNQYGKEGGYMMFEEFKLRNTKPNEGEYGYDDANLFLSSASFFAQLRTKNYYGDGDNIIDAGQYVNSLEVLHPNRKGSNNQNYPDFVFSTYNPLSILLSDSPQGSDGNVSQDSFLMQFAVKNLKKEFEERIGREAKQRTIDKANIFNANDAFDVYNLVTGKLPLISPDWSITSPANPITSAADFGVKLAGSTIPFSPIPGSYFDTNISLGQLSKTTQFRNNVRRLLTGNNTGSETFFNNTGSGQKSILFFNLKFNKYRPNLDSKFYERIFGENEERTINGVEFYVGSPNADPKFVASPSGELPLNEFGEETENQVYGPDKLSKLYEGEDLDLRIGANGRTYADGGTIEGGLTWVSPKYKGNAGRKVGVGGQLYGEDEEFNSASFTSTESTNYDFRPGTIMDDTQKLIDSQPNGAKRYQHAGNAIDQVSKIFNDGYKEITKGSKVLRYEGAIGNEVGMEYCRLFTKDTPYLTYADLQNPKGMVKSGRKFSYSVLDNAYNLNIYPVKPEGNQDSTNIIVNQATRNVKKYMFSLENLSWRTSNTPGLTVADLPICERGPNDGRIMWFPPYALKFDESVSSNWNKTEFIGRPEPVYTYKNTSRTGSISFKIVVDHPSVLNIIVNKVLVNETNKDRINNMISSFFAGCLNYDLYELAKKYNTANPNELKELQTIIEKKLVTEEIVTQVSRRLNTGNNTPSSNDTPIAPTPVEDADTLKKYNSLSFYFDNDIPNRNVDISPFDVYYNAYVSASNKSRYNSRSQTKNSPYPTSPAQTSSFFTNYVEDNYNGFKNMFAEILNIFQTDSSAKITLNLVGSASQPQTVDYNLALGVRRNDSVVSWFKTFSGGTLNQYIGNRLIINTRSEGEGALVNGQVSGFTATPKNFAGNTLQSYDCSKGDKEVFTINAMACRAVRLEKAVIVRTPAPQINPPVNPIETTTEEVRVQRTFEVEQERQIENLPKNITKRILRILLSECDYFNMIKEESPFLYDNLRDKLKYFDPAFHSTTPEGLNARLTFLQQCMRPGDTIPTVQKDGRLEYNNARNTAFGAPPVLILRIGDFYHTKIIPENLSISYESLDLNSDGIGVQPMIADVKLSFSFVGGQGLKNAVEKLQNALTFNYYANTEVYDDRSDVTDESLKVLDSEFYELLKFRTDLPTSPQNEITSLNDSLIGKVISGNTETGSISYTSYMDNLITVSQNYYTGVFNSLKTINSSYNPVVRQKFTSSRLYKLGYITPDTETKIFGKPDGFINNINDEFDSFIKSVESEEDEFLKGLIETNKFTGKLVRVLKRNYVTFIKNLKTDFNIELMSYVQTMTNLQLELTRNLTRLNILSFENIDGSDGYKDKSGDIFTYDLTSTTINGTPSKDVVTNNRNRVIDDLNKYYDSFIENKIFNYNGVTYANLKVVYDNLSVVFNSISGNEFFNSDINKRCYMILSKYITDGKLYADFKNALISNIIQNIEDFGKNNENIEIYFDNYWLNKVKPSFLIENEYSTAFLDNFQNTYLSNFYDYKPYNKNVRTEFTYTKNDNLPLVKQMVINLGDSNNTENSKDYWNKNVSGAYIAKVKLL